MSDFGFSDGHLEKRRRLLASGVSPFPYSFDGVRKIAAVVEEESQRPGGPEQAQQHGVVVAGRIWARRQMGKTMFIDLRDDSGSIQLYLKREEVGEDTWRYLRWLDLGDIVGAGGNVFRTRTGELTIRVAHFAILSKTAVPIPLGKESGETTHYRLADPESRYGERYLTWLLDPRERERIRLRSRIISALRREMESRGFLEVSTPVIEPIYGGAEARPFRTSVWALGGAEAFLRISPELYLKRYVVAGFDKVFTICSNFRNEGIDRSHNPEFTMMEWYEAFTDYAFQMEQFETLVAQVCREIHGTTRVTYQGVKLDFTPPWRRVSMLEALADAGVAASEMTAEDLSRLLVARGAMTADDLPWGVAVAELFELLCEGQLVQPTFVVDHPIEISPLTKVKRGDPRLVERFEPYVCRMEIGNAYSELTDPVDQLDRLVAQRRRGRAEDYENHPIDADFVKAIGCGMPPTGGVGLGVDRLIMLLTDASSIRDIIPFPMVAARSAVAVPRPERQTGTNPDTAGENRR